MYLPPSTSAMRHIPSTASPDAVALQGDSPCNREIQGIRHLPEFKRLIDAADALPPEQRDAQLIGLTYHIEYLPENQRAMAFALLSGAPGTLDEARFTTLAEQVPHLKEDDRLVNFNVLFEMSGKLPAGHPVALAQQIRHLTPDQRWDAFDRLLGAAAELDPPRRGAHLETLAGQIRWLHEKVRLDRFDGVLRAIDLLPAEEQRAAQWVTLATHIAHLPEKQLQRFDSILGKVTGLANEEQRVVQLKALTQQIGRLPKWRRSDVFLHILAGVEQLGRERRLARESRVALLDALGDQVCWLSSAGAHSDQLIAELQISRAVKNLNLRSGP